MEPYLLDVGGSETTQRRSASLYDKILSNPKLKLTKEGTFSLKSSDTDFPLSTFLYRLQNSRTVAAAGQRSAKKRTKGMVFSQGCNNQF